MNSYSYKPNKKFQNKEKKSFRGFFLWLLFLGIVFGGVGSYLIFSPKWQVLNIDIEGCRAIREQDLKKSLEQLFEPKVFFVFPGSSLIALSKTKISDSVMYNFPRIKNMEIDKEITNTLKIKIEEKKPVAVWCGSTEIEIVEATTTNEIIINEQKADVLREEKKKYIYELDTNNCFYVDEEGRVFEQVSDVELGLLDKNIIKIQQWKTNAIEVRKDNLELSFLNFAKSVKAELKEILSINVDKFILPNPLAKELYAVMPDGWKIYFNTEDSALAQVEILKVVLDKKIPSSEQSNLDYIDLRVGEKVFYKFR